MVAANRVVTGRWTAPAPGDLCRGGVWSLRSRDGSGARREGGQRRLSGRAARRALRQTLTAEAVSGARAAIRLDENSALGHAALAVASLQGWDLAAARSSMERSLALDPGQAVHQRWASLVHSAHGAHERAVEAASRAAALDPLSWATNADLGWAHYYARDFEAAVAHERDTRSRWPVPGPLPWFVPLSLHLAGRDEAAVLRLREDLETRGIAAPRRLAFERAAAAGAQAVARWALDVFSRQAARGPANTQMLVRLHAQRGELEDAFGWLSKAVASRAGWLVYLDVDPALDPLRGDPRLARVAAVIRSGHPRANPAPARAEGLRER